MFSFFIDQNATMGFCWKWWNFLSAQSLNVSFWSLYNGYFLGSNSLTLLHILTAFLECFFENHSNGCANLIRLFFLLFNRKTKISSNVIFIWLTVNCLKFSKNFNIISVQPFLSSHFFHQCIVIMPSSTV